MNYIPFIIALTVTIISVYGDTLEGVKDSKKKLTTKGKALLLVAVVSFAFSLYMQHNKEVEVSRFEQARNGILVYIGSSIQDAIGDIIDPIYTLGHPANTLEKMALISQMPNDKKIAEINTYEYYNSISGKNLLLPISDRKLWGDFLGENIESSRKKLKEILAVYKDYLNVETILCIEDLLNDEGFTSLLLVKTSVSVMRMAGGSELTPFLFPFEQYHAFIGKIGVLQESVNKKKL